MRLFLKLSSDVNERLRAFMRYQGELSRHIDEALTSNRARDHGTDSGSAGENHAWSDGSDLAWCQLEAPRRRPAARLLPDGTCE